jgi:hypothetical protein
VSGISGGAARFNNSWLNDGRAYAGTPANQPNLAVDPQFCDAVAGDLHLASGSRCAPSGPYGQIGALGVGCDLMTVRVDVQSHPINLSSNAPVEAAILGHRLFDPRRVDPSTVRLQAQFNPHAVIEEPPRRSRTSTRMGSRTSSSHSTHATCASGKER